MGIHVEDDVDYRAPLKEYRAFLKEFMARFVENRVRFPPVAMMWAFMLRAMWKIGLF